LSNLKDFDQTFFFWFLAGLEWDMKRTKFKAGISVLVFIIFCDSHPVISYSMSIFQGRRIHIVSPNIGPMRFQILRRNLILNGGNFCSKPGLDVEILVADKCCCWSLLEDASGNCSSSVVVVCTQWLVDCLNQSKYLDTQEYQMYPSEKEKNSTYFKISDPFISGSVSSHLVPLFVSSWIEPSAHSRP
jgi:hypothetical protein